MMSGNVRDALIMLAAGVGIPLLAALNTRLGRGIGSPPAAAIVLLTVALIIAVIATKLTTGFTPLTSLAAQPPYVFVAGSFMAFYLLSITWIAPRFGIGNAIFCVLLGQLVSAGIIDHFGLFGAIERPMSPARGGGLALMALGVALAQRG